MITVWHLLIWPDVQQNVKTFWESTVTAVASDNPEIKAPKTWDELCIAVARVEYRPGQGPQLYWGDELTLKGAGPPSRVCTVVRSASQNSSQVVGSSIFGRHRSWPHECLPNAI